MFKRAEGMYYVRYFKQLHAQFAFEWYLEIGCRNGRILEMVQGKTIGVDPAFRLKSPLLGQKPQLHLYQETSDEFFAANRIEAIGAFIDVAFVDGLHLFEFALRDILNVEAHSNPNGVIFVHDCCPYSVQMTTRDLENLPDVWTGDVWKLIPILKKYRPDLTLTVLDAQPSGLLAIQGLKPGKSQPKIDLARIQAEYETLELEDFGFDSFAKQFSFTDTRDALKNDRFGFAKLASDKNTALRPDLITP